MVSAEGSARFDWRDGSIPGANLSLGVETVIANPPIISALSTKSHPVARLAQSFL
jgi:hypothetical protein